MKIGVTAPGSGTHFMVQYFIVRNGLKPDDASFVGVGASASAVAAVRRGEIDAIVNVDPVIGLLVSQNLIKVIADTRTEAGTRQIFGGTYPAAASTRRRRSSRRSAHRAGLGQRLRARPRNGCRPIRRTRSPPSCRRSMRSATRRCTRNRSRAACRCIRPTDASAARAPRLPIGCSRNSTRKSRPPGSTCGAAYTDAFVAKAQEPPTGR